MYDRGMEKSSALDVSAFVLAGGKSTRMGADKAFVEYGGHTLLARALDVVQSVRLDVRIVGSRQKFASFAPVVEDIFRDCGPLGGIHAALLASQCELNVMLAVDMPFVSGTFLRYLISEARGAPQADAVVPRSEGRSQPLCAVYRHQFAAAAENALRSGQNRIDRLFGLVRTRMIGEEELESAGFSGDIFRNLNTPEELQEEKERT
jgi:molybdopterin-guanine dinucleotide biosynthesis protein A